MQVESPRPAVPSRWRARMRKAAAAGGCLAAGAALPLAFAPFGLYPVAFASLAALFLAWRRCATPRRAFLLGWLFGLGSFGAGISWVYESFGFANVAGPLAFALTVGLVAGLALYPAVLGWIVVRVAPAGDAPRLLAVYPAAWTLWEWIRGGRLPGSRGCRSGMRRLTAPLRDGCRCWGCTAPEP